MRKLGQFVVNFVKAEDGPTAVEYAVMLALIIVVCIGAITTLGLNANNTFSYVAGVVAPTGSRRRPARTGTHERPPRRRRGGRSRFPPAPGGAADGHYS